MMLQHVESVIKQSLQMVVAICALIAGPSSVLDVEVVSLCDQTMRTKWLCGYAIYVESNKKS